MARIVGDASGYAFALLDHEGQPTEHRFVLPAVSSLKDELNKSGLDNWKIDQTILGIKRLDLKLKGKTPKQIRDAVAEGGHGPDATAQTAADRGSRYHDIFEGIVWGEEPAETDAIVAGFVEWWRRQRADGWQMFETELPVWSLKEEFAGQLDLLLARRGKYRLVDFKPKIQWDTKRPYFDHIFQLAALSLCLEEQRGIYVESASIVTYNAFGEYPVERPELESAMRAVIGAREIKRAREGH